MNEIELLAEKILMNAAKSDDGNCYPSQINATTQQVFNALDLLEMYGTTYHTSKGANPIFTVNELGKHFASTGAWSEKEKRERLATERYIKQMEIAKKNNNLVKWSIIISIITFIITSIISILKS